MFPKQNQTFTEEEIVNHNKVVAQINKAWTKEKERRERVCITLKIDQNKSEINSEPLSTGIKSTTDKNPNKLATPKM